MKVDMALSNKTIQSILWIPTITKLTDQFTSVVSLILTECLIHLLYQTELSLVDNLGTPFSVMISKLVSLGALLFRSCARLS